MILKISLSKFSEVKDFILVFWLLLKITALCNFMRNSLKTWSSITSLFLLFQACTVKTKSFPAGDYMFKVKNRNTRTRCEICSKLTIKNDAGELRTENYYFVNIK